MCVCGCVSVHVCTHVIAQLCVGACNCKVCAHLYCFVDHRPLEGNTSQPKWLLQNNSRNCTFGLRLLATPPK